MGRCRARERSENIGVVEAIDGMESGVRGSAANSKASQLSGCNITFSREAVVVRTNFGKAAEEKNSFDISFGCEVLWWIV